MVLYLPQTPSSLSSPPSPSPPLFSFNVSWEPGEVITSLRLSLLACPIGFVGTLVQEGRNRRCVYMQDLHNEAEQMFSALRMVQRRCLPLSHVFFPELPFMISLKYIFYRHLCSGRHFNCIMTWKQPLRPLKHNQRQEVTCVRPH